MDYPTGGHKALAEAVAELIAQPGYGIGPALPATRGGLMRPCGANYRQALLVGDGGGFPTGCELSHFGPERSSPEHNKYPNEQ